MDSNSRVESMNDNGRGSASAIAVFQGNKIRKKWHNEEWWFAIEDVTFALTDSNDPKQYINSKNDYSIHDLKKYFDLCLEPDASGCRRRAYIDGVKPGYFSARQGCLMQPVDNMH